jgi:hypothetical protein
MGGSLMGGHLTDFKIWLFARSVEGENIKITCKKAWKIISHNNQQSRSPSLRSSGRNARLWDNPFQGGI